VLVVMVSVRVMGITDVTAVVMTVVLAGVMVGDIPVTVTAW